MDQDQDKAWQQLHDWSQGRGHMTASEALDMARGLEDWLERGGFPPSGILRHEAETFAFRMVKRAIARGGAA